MRYLHVSLLRTMQREKKMAFIAGPRQVGKTTLAQFLLEEAGTPQGYFNWDIPTTQQRIIRDPTLFWHTDAKPPRRIVLDEIHKYPRWKRFLKGFGDANRGKIEIVVTGSGRLDVYQRGGDSLFGRYHLFHLLPFSLGEMARKAVPPPSPDSAMRLIREPDHVATADHLDQLLQYSGFPEPLFAADRQALGRWQMDHRQLIVRDELRDLTQIREIGLIETMLHLLPERIGAPLSINALREDLNVNFLTVQNWLTALGRLYYLFAIRPYAGRLQRTLRREEKIYFYDWAECGDPAKRFENFVALHLWKAVHYWTEEGYDPFVLYYVRDKEKREVDFLVTRRGKPFWLVECKLSEKNVDPSLAYFAQRLRPAMAIQVVQEAPSQWLIEREGGLLICAADRLLQTLP